MLYIEDKLPSATFVKPATGKEIRKCIFLAQRNCGGDIYIGRRGMPELLAFVNQFQRPAYQLIKQIAYQVCWGHCKHHRSFCMRCVRPEELADLQSRFPNATWVEAEFQTAPAVQPQ